MKRLIITITLSLLLAAPAFCQGGLTAEEWKSIPAETRVKILRIISDATKGKVSAKELERKIVPATPVGQTLTWMVEDGRYSYYEANVFPQLPPERKVPADRNYVYSRWFDMTDVSATYISPEMYEMVGTLPKISVRGRTLDLSNVIQRFKALYLLDFARFRSADPKVRYCRNYTSGGLRKDIRDFLKANNYTTLMDLRKDGQYTRLYMATEGDMVTGFVVVSLDDSFDYGRFICLEGQMPKDRFEEMIRKALK